MKTYPIALVPGPTSIPQRVRDAWNMDFGSSDLEGEFFELYADNQRLVQRLLGTKEDVVITLGEAMSILWGALKCTLKPGDRLLAVASGLHGAGYRRRGGTLRRPSRPDSRLREGARGRAALPAEGHHGRTLRDALGHADPLHHGAR